MVDWLVEHETVDHALHDPIGWLRETVDQVRNGDGADMKNAAGVGLGVVLQVVRNQVGV
jgi:hypothetical protein